MTGLVRRALGGALGGAVAAALLAGTLANASPSSAAAAPCPPTTLAHDIKTADVVFRGVVTNVRPVRGTGDQRTRNYRVQADRVYKGSLVTDSVTLTARVGTRCAASLLAQDKRYLIFATEEGSQLMATGATARATRARTDKVVARLGVGRGAAPDATGDRGVHRGRGREPGGTLTTARSGSGPRDRQPARAPGARQGGTSARLRRMSPPVSLVP